MESPPTQVVAPPPKRKRRIRRVLCGIRDLIERLLTPTAIVVITVLLLVASWIYPPWVSYGRYPQHDWYFIFSTRTGSMRIDLARLLLIDLIIAVPCALLAWMTSRNTGARRIAAWIVFYAIVYLVLALATVGIVWGGAVLIQNVQHEVAKRVATPTKRFDPATATLVAPQPSAQSKASLYDALIAYLARKQAVIVEIPGQGIVQFPARMSDDEIAAVIKKKSFPGESSKSEDWFAKNAPTPIPTPTFDPDKYLAQTAPVDLKKITLFDVEPDGVYFYGCSGFHGRVRNGLPRAVEKIGVKASFYNAQAELIEVRTFWLQPVTGNVYQAAPPVFPNTPVSFKNSVGVEHLPQGWRYQLEVTEAQYVK